MRMLRKLYVQARLDIDDDMMDAMIANEHIPTDHDDNGILRVDMDSCEQNILISMLIKAIPMKKSRNNHHGLFRLLFL